MIGSLRHDLFVNLNFKTYGFLKWVTDYRLTIGFATTALIIIAAATTIVYQVIGNVAGDSLAGGAEDQASRDAINVESRISGQFSMLGLDPTTMTIGESLDPSSGQHHKDITLELLTGPQGLDLFYPSITHGLNILQMKLLA